MSIYFDFKTINELTGDNYSRKPKEFTLEELSQYNGSNGRPAYVAIEGIVYDISNSAAWGRGTYFGIIAGQDLTNQFNSCHGIMDILTNAPKVGTLIEEDYMSDMNNMGDMNNMSSMGNFKCNMSMKRQVSQDKSKFTPDDWIGYITPLVTYALREPSQGTNTQNFYQKVILMGVLVGLGKTPQEAINQVREWQNTGVSQILKSGAGTSGSTGIGFGGGTGGSTGSGAGTSGGMGTGGAAGTGFGGGTGGSTGSGAGTFGGMGTGGTTGTGFGTGFGTSTVASGNINKISRLDLD